MCQSKQADNWKLSNNYNQPSSFCWLRGKLCENWNKLTHLQWSWKKSDILKHSRRGREKWKGSGTRKRKPHRRTEMHNKIMSINWSYWQFDANNSGAVCVCMRMCFLGSIRVVMAMIALVQTPGSFLCDCPQQEVMSSVCPHPLLTQEMDHREILVVLSGKSPSVQQCRWPTSYKVLSGSPIQKLKWSNTRQQQNDAECDTFACAKRCKQPETRFSSLYIIRLIIVCFTPPVFEVCRASVPNNND